MEQKIFKKKLKFTLPFFISFLLLFSLSLESFPLPIRAQIIPLTSVLALFLLPFFLRKIKISPLFIGVILFFIYVIFHSLVALFVETIILGSKEIRLFAWIRQVIALLSGFSVFLILRKILIKVSDRFIIYSIVAGAVPALLVAFLNIFWGISGNTIAGNIVKTIRSTLIPLGFTHPSRASGLSLEPAHFASYLALIVIPVSLVAFLFSKKRLSWLFFIFICLVAFTFTVSTIGLILILSLLIAGILFGPKRSLFFLLAIVVSIFTIVFILLFPENYAISQVKLFFSGNWQISISDRFYSSFGPLMNIFSSYNLLGYGLGGTSTQFKEIIPPAGQKYILAVRWKEMPSLGTLFGRLLAETGLIGFVLFFVIIFIAFREIKGICQKSSNKLERTFLKISKVVLIVFLIGAILRFGSFAFPILWFWLGFIDSHYFKKESYE